MVMVTVVSSVMFLHFKGFPRTTYDVGSRFKLLFMTTRLVGNETSGGLCRDRGIRCVHESS